MKKSLLTIAFYVFAAGSLLTSCNDASEDVEDAKENVTEANEELERANKEYLKDMENYRIETYDKIAANKKIIQDFNERMANEKKEVKADYKKKMDELDQQNTDMQKRMEDYKADGKENWETFKTEFSQDMDALGKSFKDLFTSSK